MRRSALVLAAPVLFFAACTPPQVAAPPATSAARSAVPTQQRAGGEAAATRQTWLLTSDWHFNPYDDPKLVDALIREPATHWRAILAQSTKPIPPYFQNTNFALLESALAAMRAVEPNPPVVIVGGDSLSHRFRETFFELEPGAPEKTFEAFVDKTFAFLALEMNRTYPQAQFFITVGNNDGYCGNYKSTPRSPFFAHLAAAWEPLVNRNGRAPDFVREFSNAGYYTATLPSRPPMPAIALNSVFWSSFYSNDCGVPGSDPGSRELSWLSTHLRAKNTVLLTHIPIGVDEYASLNADKPVPLYNVRYTQRLLDILAARGISPSAFIIGHIHHATFEIAPTAGGELGALVMPAITPVQGNNPAFMLASIGSAGPTIADTTTYVLPLASATPAWVKLYSFDQAYGLSAFDARNLHRLQTRMANDTAVRRQFFHYYNSASTTATPDPGKWRWYWCGHVHLTPPPYAACVSANR